MLKFTHRLTSVLLAVFCLLPLFSMGASASSSQSDGDQALYVEKYVSVLYDNSGSMLNKDNRSYYATYAFQMLASLMNSSDKLWVTPMNVNAKTSATVSNSRLFTFSDNRENDIKTFVSEYLAQGKPLAPVSGAPTPLSSISVARERLFKTDDINGYTDNRDRKRWLVIMTDGIFTDDSGELPVERAVEEMMRELDENPDLNIIYLGMGDAADLGKSTYTDNKTEKQNPLYSRYAGRFYGFKANTAENVVASMRDVVNLMSDRYTLNETAEDFITLSDDKKTATVKLSYVSFPLQSISFAVQNFGGNLNKAIYSGVTFTPDNCVITPPTELGMQSGATGIIRDNSQNPILFNTADSLGDLVLCFDTPVEKENIALMAEPSLYIRPVFEYEQNGQWVEGSEVDVMKYVSAGDKIKVGYRVYNGATGKPYTDLAAQLPGETFATVYVGNTLFADKLKEMSDEITLSVGSNPIKLNVSLMDGVYRLEKTVDIKIIGSTAGYSMTATHTPADSAAPNKTTSIFTPRKDNAAMTAAELSEYTATVTVKNMEGVTVLTGAEAVLRDDGTYLVELDLSSQPFGEYSLELSLSHNYYPITLSAQALPQYYPAEVALDIEGESEITKTQNGFERGQYRAITFTLSADGKALDFNNGLLDYELKFGNTVIDKTAYTVSGNKLSFVPDYDTVGALLSRNPAEYAITLSVSSQTHSHLTDTKTAKLILTATQLEVILVKNDQLPIDRFDIQNTPAEMCFAVICDDTYLTEDELLVALGQKEMDEATKTVGTLTITSDWCDNFWYPVNLSTPEIVAMTVDGKTVDCVKVVIEAGHIGFVREHLTSWFIPSGDKPIVARYENASASAEVESAFVLATSTGWSYFWRLLVIILWIQIFLGLVLNAKVPRHDRGYFVCLQIGNTSSGKPTVKITPVNMTFMARAVPLRWIIPFYPVMAQKEMGDINDHIVFNFRHIERGANGKTASLDKTVDKVVFKKSALIFNVRNLSGDSAEEFRHYVSDCAKQPSPTSANLTPRTLTNEKLRNLLPPVIEHNDVGAASNYIPRNSVCRRFSRDNVYAFYSERTGSGGKVTLERLIDVVFFVPKA